MSVRGPEKAGVGGSIPSLATMFSITYRPLEAQSHFHSRTISPLGCASGMSAGTGMASSCALSTARERRGLCRAPLALATRELVVMMATPNLEGRAREMERDEGPGARRARRASRWRFPQSVPLAGHHG